MSERPPAELGAAGVPDAARTVVRELISYRETVLAFLRARIRSGADAEDVFQQALLRAAERASSVRDPSRTRAWFFQIVRRVLADHHAQWAAREARLAMLVGDVDEQTPEEIAVCGCSLGQLDRIRPEYADILRRVDIEEEPLARVATALGITVNNATVRLHRARKALREQLQTFCGTDSMRACLDCACND